MTRPPRNEPRLPRAAPPAALRLPARARPRDGAGVPRAAPRGARGGQTAARLWLETVHDLLTTAPRQHLAMLRQDVGYAVRTLGGPGLHGGGPADTGARHQRQRQSSSPSSTPFSSGRCQSTGPAELRLDCRARESHIEMPHGVSFRDLQDYRAAGLTKVFSGVMGYEPGRARGCAPQPGRPGDRGGAHREQLHAAGRRHPARGRVFNERPTRYTPVLVLAHDYWQGAASAAIRSGDRRGRSASTVVPRDRRRRRAVPRPKRVADPCVSGFVPAVPSLDQL